MSEMRNRYGRRCLLRVQLDATTQEVLNRISEEFAQKGAYNLRQNGVALCHGDSEHIKIRKKEDKPGIDILIDGDTKFFINPTGRFVIGGPHGDAGLTGRKIIVDTYGGYARHGGGAFSGKDCTKVDRSAAYAARYVAKNIVAAGLADKCEIQLSYAIGVAQPTSVMVDTFGTGKIADDELVKIVRENFDLRPAGIIKMLDLRRPIYRQTAAYGHFGRNDLNLPWEATNKAEALKKYL